MLETAWESRWMPEIEIISESCLYINWFLPVIKDQKKFWFLMTDKDSVTCTLKTTH